MSGTDHTQDGWRRGGILMRLRRDQRGNVLYMFAMSIVPMVGFIGGAVDMSRAYLVKTRMQQACDAGALAGRKSMSGTTLTAADQLAAEKYFRFNFPNGTMNTQNLAVGSSAAPNTIVIAKDANNQLLMSASATMPNVFMPVFGFADQVINVSCKAEEYYVNTDVMMVLDTTGSMNCTISDATTCGQATEKPSSKMQSLRDAVKTLYANLRPAQDALEAKSLRMRIGFVMYSSNVNVGKLIYAADPTYINNPSNSYRNNTGANGTPYNGPTQTAAWFTGTGASDWGGCIVERQTDGTLSSGATSIPAAAFDLDISTLPTSAATRWSPYVPTLYIKNAKSYADYSDATANSQGYTVCPLPAVHMQSWTSTAAFNTYVDTIQTGRGGTYHDIGMIWGTRMIANTGIFGSRNPDTFNAVKVRRTIVLVTDGYTAPNADIYGAYGVERYDHKSYGAYSWGGSEYTNAEFIARHEKRFNLMCDRAKSMNIDIWVVAMLDNATAMPANLTNCAASGQALKVSNTTALNDAFKAISDKVGNLRVGG